MYYVRVYKITRNDTVKSVKTIETFTVKREAESFRSKKWDELGFDGGWIVAVETTEEPKLGKPIRTKKKQLKPENVVTTDICKNAIIEKIKQNQKTFVNLFYPPLDDTMFNKFIETKHWKRYNKYISDGKYERNFYFKAYGDGDEVYATVYTNEDDTQILSIEIGAQ